METAAKLPPLLPAALTDPARLPLGSLLVRGGLITAEQHGLEYLDLPHAEIDPDAVALLPAKLARRYEALPVRFLAENVVLVAIADPTDVVTTDTSVSRSASTSTSSSPPRPTSGAPSPGSTGPGSRPRSRPRRWTRTSSPPRTSARARPPRRRSAS